MATFDLNADLGELPGAAGADLDAALLSVVTSANIACGGHAGDAASMRRVCRVAAQRDVAIGAHISYPDRPRFGRHPVTMPPGALRESLLGQAMALRTAAHTAGATVAYVKPHGALYHDAATDPQVADIVADVGAELGVGVLTLPGRRLTQAARARQVPSYGEAFADRGYRGDGSLVPRSAPGAVVVETDLVTQRVTAIAAGRPIATTDGGTVLLTVDSVCLHGDTPGAVTLAHAVARTLTETGVTLAPFAPGPS